MPNAFASVGYNEEVPINSSAFDPLTGTETLTAVICTLRDAQGAIIAGCNGVAADNFTDGPSVAPYAVYNFSATELSLPVPVTQDTYVLTFLASDSLENSYASNICIVLRPPGR